MKSANSARICVPTASPPNAINLLSPGADLGAFPVPCRYWHLPQNACDASVSWRLVLRHLEHTLPHRPRHARGCSVTAFKSRSLDHPMTPGDRHPGLETKGPEAAREART